MRLFAPDYYKNFKCVASACKHNCCIGWEIDIDEDTAEYYKRVKGTLGEKLKRNISYEDCPHFVLCENERCPFLNENNLCEIIAELGEDALCQICNDHPRFRNICSDREEIGLGLSCEEAARIIVEKKDVTRIVELSDDGDRHEIRDDEKEFLKLRDDIFAILQNRDKRISDRLSEILTLCDADAFDTDIQKHLDTYLGLECLDKSWQDLLCRMKETEYDTSLPFEFDVPFEQISVYFVYRHLSKILDFYTLAEVAYFCVMSVNMIMSVCAYHRHQSGTLTLCDIAEFCRMYSSEIEYSEENTDILMSVEA